MADNKQKFPSELIDLPSGGKLYPDGSPLQKGKIELKYMTAKEEDILTSQNLIKKGVVLDYLINSLILSDGISSDDLLIGDKNAIIVATRISGYGNEYNTAVTCPDCGVNQKYTFDLNENSVYGGEDCGDLGVTNNQNGTFSVELPKTKVNVVFRLLNGADERRVSPTQKKGSDERNITRQIASIVLSVNEDSSVEARQYLVNNIPSMDSRHLRLAYRLAAPNIDLSQHFECEECGHEQEMEVPLTADFFWPDR